ncbi:MAG: phosphoribosylglycinamide formyltransferase [Ignavibacteria bacterium]|nr:MAG: phosphoribosylglycinamide formyltransferase [Ignavibacteria bacterium]
MTKIAVFVSGRGSNFKALHDYLSTSGSGGEIVRVVSNKVCPALEYAREIGIPYSLVAEKSKEDFIDYESLLKEFKELNVRLIVLAGFLKKIPDMFIDGFDGNIINIHPALLPAFGGKGMYGMNVHKAVFESSAKYSGATVHFVDKVYDHGKIIDQAIVDIHDVSSPEEIAARVLEQEHKLLPRVVSAILSDRVKIVNNRVVIVGESN